MLRDFGDVTRLTRGDPIPPWQPTRLNVRYHTALRLAELVLKATSADQNQGEVAFNGFLLDMPKVYEDFVSTALKGALEHQHGGRVATQDRHFLDEGSRQILSYCTVLDLPEGHLVYAKGNETAAHHTVRQSGTEIICHALDLSKPAADLLNDVSLLAHAIAKDAQRSARDRSAPPL